MVADEGEGDYADGLEDAGVDEKGTFYGAFEVGRREGSLDYDCEDDDEHGD